MFTTEMKIAKQKNKQTKAKKTKNRNLVVKIKEIKTQLKTLQASSVQVPVKP